MGKLDEIREELGQVETELELEVAKAQLSALRDLREGEQGFPDRNTNGEVAQPTNSLIGRNLTYHRSRIYDRAEGRHIPFYETELDLQMMRAKCRNLSTFTSIFIGASEALNVYVMGGDWEYKAQAKFQGDEKLASAVQAVVDCFIEDNDWVGTVDDEIHDQCREDGDLLVGLYPMPGGRSKVNVIGADSIREPKNKYHLNEWLGTENSGWWFGVHVNYESQMGCYDYHRPLGYHVVFDDSGRNWDYLPRWPQKNALDDLRCGTMFKRGTPTSAARGWSDYAPLVEDFEGEWKLARGTRIGATIQSHIAYILENAEGVGIAQASSAAGGKALLNRILGRTAQEAGVHSQSYLPPGSRLSVNAGQKYHAGPMGSIQSSIFMEVAQFGLRRIGIRWLMPEYMISGDASNANYASTMVSQSPFVKAREREQAQFKRGFRKVIRKALYIAWAYGRFDRFVTSWDDLMARVDITITAPAVASDDKLAQVQRNQILHGAGILSTEAWAAAEGIEPEQTQAAQQPEAGTGELSSVSRLQWQRNRKAIDDILSELIAGTTTEAKARIMLGALGMTAQNVDALIADAADGSVDSFQKEPDDTQTTEESRFERARQLLWEGYP